MEFLDLDTINGPIGFFRQGINELNISWLFIPGNTIPHKGNQVRAVEIRAGFFLHTLL